MTFRAYQDNVLVRFERAPERTGGGLYIPQTASEKTRFAVVIAVGPGHMRGAHFVPTQVQVGDRVLVDARAGQNYDMDLTVPRHNKPTEWADDRGEFRIIREEEILAVAELDAKAAE